MKGFRAALIKDITLFLKRSGIIALFLPIVLLAAFRIYGNEMLRPAYLDPFPIGIQDCDNTIMSRSLIKQLEEVELFSEVICQHEGENSEELLTLGCAAVVTIPKDFFYTMYRMEDNAVTVVLNKEKPMEAELFRAVIDSVMNIIAANQSTGKAVYQFCYGTLSKEQEKELWSSNSKTLLADALGRQGVFENSLTFSNIQEDVQHRITACALSVLIFFFSVTAVKTFPEEISMGILQRYLAAGGKMKAFVLSKFCVTLALAVPSLLPLLFFDSHEHSGVLLLFILVYFVEVFGCLFLLASVLRDGSAIQRFSNYILLGCLVLGGTLYAKEYFPPVIQNVTKLVFSYRILQGIELINEGADIAELIKLQIISLTIGGMAGYIGLKILNCQGLNEKKALKCKRESVLIEKEEKSSQSEYRKQGIYCVWKLAVYKLKVVGGGWGIAALGAVLFSCAWLASFSLQSKGPESLRIYIAMEKEGALANQLIENIGKYDGISLLSGKEKEGRKYLEKGQVEGLLIIGEDYEYALWNQDQLPLYYESGTSAVSEQAAREIIAGQVMLQKARIRGIQDAEIMIKRTMTDAEKKSLIKMMEYEWENFPPLYTATANKGSSIQSATVNLEPDQMGFMTLAVFLTLLTWGTWMGQRDVRRVEQRMKAVYRGKMLSYGSDVLALWCAGMLAGLCALLPLGKELLEKLPALSMYVLCVTGVSLAMTRYTAQSGRMDAWTPFVVMITCTVGGCFGNMGDVSPLLKKISLITPQGLTLYADKGSQISLLFLFVAGLVLLWLGAPDKNG